MQIYDGARRQQRRGRHNRKQTKTFLMKHDLSNGITQNIIETQHKINK